MNFPNSNFYRLLLFAEKKVCSASNYANFFPISKFNLCFRSFCFTSHPLGKVADLFFHYNHWAIFWKSDILLD